MEGAMRHTGRLLLIALITAFAFAPGVLEADDGVDADHRPHQTAVAWVRAPSGGLLPVSSDGVLLPPNRFTAEDTRQYLQIDVGGLGPIGPVGAKFGYAVVTDAASVAVALSDIWRDAKLNAIAVASSGEETPHEFVLEPKRHGIKVLWGHAPGSEEEGEATAATKVKRLTRFVSENTPEYTLLPRPSAVLDLRPVEGAVFTTDSN